MRKGMGVFIALTAAVFVVLLDLVNAVFNLSGGIFAVELILLIILGLIGLFAIYNNKHSSMMLFFLLVLLNILLLFAATGEIESIQAIFALLGLVVILLRSSGYDITGLKEKIQPYYTEPYYDGPNAVEEKAVKSYDVGATFSPGRYIASRAGKKYHVATCDWAKKINKRSRVWFSDKGEAKKEGYKADSCIR